MTKMPFPPFSRRSALITLMRLFWLAGTLAVIVYNRTAYTTSGWPLVLVTVLIGCVLTLILALIPRLRRWLGLVSALFDLVYLYIAITLTHSFFVFMAIGSMAVLFASLNGRRRLVLLTGALVTIEALQIYSNGNILTHPASDGLWLALLFLIGLTVVADVMRGEGNNTLLQADEIARLRASRERLQSVYRRLGTINAAAENYQQALVDLLQSGIVDLGKSRSSRAVRGAILIVESSGLGNQRIRVTADYGLNSGDEALVFSGQQGMLALALRQSAPVFSADPSRDPELRAISGLNGMQSLIVIPLRQHLRTFGMLLLASSARSAFSDDDQDVLNIVGAQLTATLQNMRLYQELHQEQSRLIDAEEEARKKLARDLHDGPAQSISLIAMRLNYIRVLAERTPDQIGDELYKTEEVARRTSREIRHMLFTLRPLALETVGLTAALQQFADKMKETHNQNVIVEANPDADTLFNQNTQGVLFYIAEEAVGNARKHAQAAHIYIRLLHRGDDMLLEIQDDGKGFDVSAVTDNYEKRGSLGMINMQERTEMLNGRLDMTSAPGKGTKITVTVPLNLGTAMPTDDERSDRQTGEQADAVASLLPFVPADTGGSAAG